ncbi:MAG: DUF6882 domain-containing protein [Pseudomonadota bacterium]
MGHAERFQVKCPRCGAYHAAKPDSSFDALVEDACAAVTSTTQQLYEAFEIGRTGGRWHLDREAGEIVWSGRDRPEARAPFHAIGGWIEATGSWLWAWGHTHMKDGPTLAADRARLCGERRGMPILTEPYLIVSADDAWHLTSIGAFLAELPGTYRAKVNDKAWAYWAFGEPRWA